MIICHKPHKACEHAISIQADGSLGLFTTFRFPAPVILFVPGIVCLPFCILFATFVIPRIPRRGAITVVAVPTANRTHVLFPNAVVVDVLVAGVAEVPLSRKCHR